MTETEGFEPSYRDKPINAFRVRRVTTASLRLLSKLNFFIIHENSDFVNRLLRKKEEADRKTCRPEYYEKKSCQH